MTVPQDKDCYGQYWEENNAECAGGFDPMFVGIGGSKIRPRCDLYDQCGRMFRMNDAQRKLQQVTTQQVIPANNLTRTTQTLSPIRPVAVQQYRQQYPTTPTTPTRSYAPAPPPQQVVHQQPSQYYPSVYSPIQTLLPHESPTFLTTTEAPIEGVSVWKRIFVESMRAGLKGVLQQGSFIVDHTPYYFSQESKK